MRNARTTLAILAFAAMFGCTVQSPATTPTTVQVKLQFPATESTVLLTRDLAQRFADQYDDPGFDVHKRSYETLMEQLAAGSISYFTASHIPEHEDIWAAPLAVDGLAVIVHPDNPVANLSIEALRDIFAGRINDWSAFGEEALEIKPLTTSAGSDTYLEFQRMVTGVTGITGNARLMPSFSAMLSEVAKSAGAIGYLPLSRVDDSVKLLAIGGVQPNASTMRDKVYPLRSTIYVIGLNEPPAAYHNLIGWIQSEASQAIVSESFTALP